LNPVDKQKTAASRWIHHRRGEKQKEQLRDFTKEESKLKHEQVPAQLVRKKPRSSAKAEREIEIVA